MKFEETNYTQYKHQNIIYFLTYHDDVVYVGKSYKGVSRIEAHVGKKLFDKAYYIECDFSDLDYLENLYITKYKPKYNKAPNYLWAINLKDAAKQIRRNLNLDLGRMDSTKLRAICIENNIKFHNINNKICISRKAVYKIECMIAYNEINI